MDVCEKLMTMPYGLAVAVKNIMAAAESSGVTSSSVELLVEARNLLDADLKRRTKALSEKEKKTAPPKERPAKATAKTISKSDKTEAVVPADDDDSPEMEKVNGKWRIKEAAPATKPPKKKSAAELAKELAKKPPVEDLDIEDDLDEEDDLNEVDLDEDEDDETAGIDT